MLKLSKLKVNQILTQFVNENPQIKLTESKIQDTVDLFDKLMNEKVNQSKNLWEQEALVTDIAIGYSFGEQTDFIFRQHADNKHLNYFDVFLEQGEAEKIQKALLKYNISTDVLKGIKKNIDFDIVIDKIRIVQTMSDGENTSPTIESFEIYKDKKLIYRWGADEFLEKEYNNTDSKFDEYYRQESKVEIPKEPPPTKSGKRRKGIYLGTVISSNGDKVIIEKLTNGQTVYRASNGRFTKI